MHKCWKSGWLQGLLVLSLAACQNMQPGDDNTKPAPQSVSKSVIRSATEKVEATDENVEQAKYGIYLDYKSRVQKLSAMTFAQFEASVYREPESGKYVVDGDTPIDDRKHLQEFFETKIKKMDRVSDTGALIVNTSGGVDTKWSGTQKRNLTYCVSTGFGSRYNTVITAMQAAALAWEVAADIDFIHDAGQDANCTATNNQVVFDVGPISNAPYLARAFFPDDPRSSRNVMIDDSSFELEPGNLTLTGILRHELGHTLGFRHEHTRPNAGTCFEDNNWRALTAYDAFSTMHYPQCNGGGDWTLALTDQDRSGAACLYGAAPGFTIDTGICTPEVVPVPPSGCGPQTVTESGSVGLQQIVQIGSYDVAPGSQFNVEMVGSGDPDMYVRWDNPPSITSYNCRPYRSGAAESCNLTVPAGVGKGFVMVRGYRAGTYQLTIEHTPSP